ncbi:hypothetical protein ZWY2020_018762 [Hordeum vulgare]|nr:hypothetical protein ZWY2020_018762 [Hordeum vulgare]
MAPSLAATPLPATSSHPSSSSSVQLLRSLARSRRADHAHRALLLFRSLHASPSPPPPHFSLPAALSAASFLSALPEGRQLHALAAKLALAPAHTVVANSLLHLYASCGLPDAALALFRCIPAKSLVSWNTAVDALASNADHLGALDLFRRCSGTGLAPDAYTLQSVLGACAGPARSRSGSTRTRCCCASSGAHGDVSRDVLINNSLVDLYGKCGAVELARQVFDRMPERDVTSWNVAILTLANHGCVREYVELFDRMPRGENVVPNAITFVAVLSACNHGGMVEEGRRYFDMMVGEYRIRPRIEHYGCMVDILARAGFIEEALDVVSGMNCRPDAIIWRSLLDACCRQNAGLELSEAMAKLALDVPDDAVSGVYVLLSRVYALRTEVERCDTSHPQSEEIYAKLDEIEQRLASSGYKPDLSEARMVAGMDHTKGAALRLHSERLAISFGLLKGTAGAPIRILKNLRGHKVEFIREMNYLNDVKLLETTRGTCCLTIYF